MDAYELRSELEDIKRQLKNADIPETLFNNKELIGLALKKIMIDEFKKTNDVLIDIRGKLSRSNHFGM